MNMDTLYCGLTVVLLMCIHCVFGIGLAKSTCDTYVPCAVPGNYRVESIANVTVSGKTINLIKSDTALSWCQSYQMCQSILGTLTIIDDPSIQHGIDNITVGSDESVWVSGTRKKHGNDWTWVNETLDDCEYTGTVDEVNCNQEVQDGREYGYVYNPAGTIRVGTTADSLAQERGGICKYNFTEDANRWHGNQKECFRKDNRLATLEEVERNHGTIPNTNFHIGLQYRPWIWLDEDMTTCTASPIIFNNWKGPDRQRAGLADCLTVTNEDGTWEEHSCTEQLHYFLCTGDIRIPDPDPGTSSTEDIRIPDPAISTTDEAITSESPLVPAGKDVKVLQGILGLFVVLTCVVTSVAIILGIKMRSLKSKQTEADPSNHDYYNMGPASVNVTQATPSDKRSDISGDYLTTASGDTRIHTSGDVLDYESTEDPDRPYGSLNGNMRDPPEVSSPTYASLQ